MISISQRKLRSNIWRGICSATDQEIIDGLSFYPGAHGLCRLIASIFSTTPRQVAGVYAALSPMNTWDTNVSNIFDIYRYVQSINNYNPLWSSSFPSPPKVNTTNINRDKAINIAAGSEPEIQLRGPKILAFYRAIADPSNLSDIPIDRHLICLALGIKITSNTLLSRVISSKSSHLIHLLCTHLSRQP